MSEETDRGYDQQDALQRVRAVKNTHQSILMAKANVVGLGVGFAQQGQHITDKVALIVLVSRKMPHSMLSAEDIIPSEIEGVPVDVQEVGTIKAMT